MAEATVGAGNWVAQSLVFGAGQWLKRRSKGKELRGGRIGSSLALGGQLKSHWCWG